MALRGPRHRRPRGRSRSGAPPGRTFVVAGEADFRRRELAALRRALDADAVVATGGGVVTTPVGRRLLRDALTVWLDATDDVIVERLDDVERPLLGEDPAASLAGLRREREAWYREVSRVRVDVDAPPDEVAERVIEAVVEVAP